MSLDVEKKQESIQLGMMAELSKQVFDDDASMKMINPFLIYLYLLKINPFYSPSLKLTYFVKYR